MDSDELSPTPAGQMHLRPESCLLAAACLALLTCGRAGDVSPHLRTASSRERELDSVILRCRTSLAAAPDDANLHTRLGQALLERFMLREGSFQNMAWWVPRADLATVKNAGVRIGPGSARRLPDTLRDAASHIATALALRPDYAAAHRVMGRLYIAQGWGPPGDSMFEKATAQFDTSLVYEPSSAEGYYGLGCSLLRRNRYAEALTALNKSVSFDSSNGSAYLTLGEVYMDTGNVTVAFACYENASRLGLSTAGEYIQLAGHYIDEQAERRLLGRLASLRMQAPGFLKPTVRAGLQLISMYHPGIAMDLCSRALAIDSSCAEAHLLKTRLYLEEGDSANALDEYLDAFEIGTAPYAYYGWFPRELLERAYDRMPESDVLLYLLGQPGVNTSESASSSQEIAIFQNTIERRPKSTVAAFLLGQAYAIRKDTARAVEWLDRAMELPPEVQPSMYWRMHDAYLEMGQIPRAVQVYRKHLIEEEGNWILELLRKEDKTRRYARERVLLGATYCAVGYDCSWRIRRGKPGYWKDRAIELFNRATQIIPESAVPYNGLGDLSIDLGDNEEGCRYYRKAAALGSQDAVETLRRLEGK